MENQFSHSRRDEGWFTGCKHGLPKLLASNDRRGDSEYLGWGGEKRRLPTAGSANGMPASAGELRRISHRNLRTNTPEKFQASRLKTTSCEGGVTESYAWLAKSKAPGQQDGREEYVEERPHDAESLKQCKCGGAQ